MAQEPMQDLINAVMQAESRGQRYTDGKLTTSTKGAQGEMQVMPKTQRAPGFGVKPAQDDSPEEIARVGKDYLQALVKKFGDTNTALIAYNWGPGNTNKWLAAGADQTKLPKETQDYVARVNRNLTSTQVAQRPTTQPTAPATQPTAQAQPPVKAMRVSLEGGVHHPMLEQLGPSYQAALALSMLADEGEKEGKSETEDNESEKMLKEYMASEARPVALASIDLGYQSPFPVEEKPVAKMAAGGVPFVPTATVRPSAKQQLNDIKAQWDAYNNKATAFNTQADEYNKQVAAYNAGPRSAAFSYTEPTAPTQPTVSAEQYQAMADAAKRDAAQRNMALNVAADPERFGLSINKFFADGGAVYRAGGSPDTGEVGYFQDPFGVPDSGPITADTLAKGKDFKAADALRAVKEVGTGVAKTGKAIVQGVSETPYNLAGAPVDIATMVMRPFGYDVKEPTFGSEHLKRLALEAGIRQAPPEDERMRGFYTIGELGAGLVNPGPIAAKVGQATEKAVATGGKAVAREMLRGMEGEGVLAPIMPQGSIMYAVPPDRPFVGRLDEFIDTIKNPVQLGQLKGQLKGKFRDYDLERVERAFTGMDDKTKLTPDQIKQALAGTHSPERWISETRPVEAGKFHQGQDNIWGAPLGTTNLYLEQSPEKAAASALFDKAASTLGRLGPKSTRSMDFDAWINAKLFLEDQNLAEHVSPEIVNSLSQKLEKVRPSVVSIENASNEIRNIENGLLWPVLYKNPEAAQGAHGGQPYFRFMHEAEDAIRKAALEEKIAQGMNENQAWKDVYVDPDFYRQMRSQVQRIAVQKVHELTLQDMQRMGMALPDMSRLRLDLPLPKGVSEPDRLPRLTPEFRQSVEDALEPKIQEVHEAEKRIRKFLADDINLVGEALNKYRPYEGGHRAITTQPHPIGFTRFSEHEATIPGMGTVQGRHFHELQSDLSKEMRASGAAYGSIEKDKAEYDQLNDQVRKLRYQNFPDTGEFSDISEFNKAQRKWEAIQNSKIQNMEKRISVLGNRIRGNPSYSLEEPFAGFETNQMVRQQLLMKNAIQAAMRDGMRFATFPGEESAKPQLYVDKVYPNLKQVAKDLGGEKAGFSVQPIQLPPDRVGNPITAWGITWSPEAAAKIIEKGVPFAKGGMVERQTSTARYI